MEDFSLRKKNKNKLLLYDKFDPLPSIDDIAKVRGQSSVVGGTCCLGVAVRFGEVIRGLSRSSEHLTWLIRTIHHFNLHLNNTTNIAVKLDSNICVKTARENPICLPPQPGSWPRPLCAKHPPSYGRPSTPYCGRPSTPVYIPGTLDEYWKTKQLKNIGNRITSPLLTSTV